MTVRNLHRLAPQASRISGFTMIEVLITLIVLALGLLGVIGLQARGQQAELESYQRGQALVLLQDLVDRMNTNRAAAHSLSYVTSSPVGGGGTLTDCSSLTGANYDLCDWGNQLNGAAEVTGGGTCTTSSGANSTTCSSTCRLVPATCRWAWRACCRAPIC
jgi:type IV pilus assembly protein PilV